MRRRIQSRNAQDAKRLGALIRDARERLAVSQQQLGDSLNLTDAQVSRLERGLNTTDAERLIKISRILEIDPEELLRLSGYTLLAEELELRSEGSAWAERHKSEASAVTPSDIKAVQRLLDRLNKLPAARGR